MTPLIIALTIFHTAAGLLCAIGLCEAAQSRDWLIVGLHSLLIGAFLATVAVLNGGLA